MALPGCRVLQLVTGGWQPGSGRVSCMQFLAISDLFWRAEIFSMIRFHVRFVFIKYRNISNTNVLRYCIANNLNI